jgi:hypothetical protein
MKRINMTELVRQSERFLLNGCFVLILIAISVAY